MTYDKQCILEKKCGHFFVLELQSGSLRRLSSALQVICQRPQEEQAARHQHQAQRLPSSAVNDRAKELPSTCVYIRISIYLNIMQCSINKFAKYV